MGSNACVLSGPPVTTLGLRQYVGRGGKTTGEIYAGVGLALSSLPSLPAGRNQSSIEYLILPTQPCGLLFAKSPRFQVALSTAIGTTDGQIDGRRFFRCRERHGVLVLVSLVKLVTANKYLDALNTQAHKDAVTGTAACRWS